MLKVLSVVDKQGTAIDRLAQGLKKYHDNIDFQIVDVHPKRPSPEQLQAFEEHLDADIIDWGYFRTAEMIRSKYDLKQPQILTHFNPYSITESDWAGYDIVVACNKYIEDQLSKVRPVEYIPLTVDTDFWIYQREWKPREQVLMVANRIESKKGILPVVEACKKIGMRFVLVGSISDPDYFNKIMAVGADIVFGQEIPDEELRQLYYDSKLLVCNSVDNFESGTLPILEAMLCGTPVLTRNVGHVPELNNKENMIIQDQQPEDVIKDLNKALSSDLETIRSKAWDTAKARSNERRAVMYQRLYRQLQEDKPVSVIVPVFDKPDTITACINAVERQDYDNLEIIVCDDGENEQLIRQLADKSKRMFRYLHTEQGDYGLARARNLGIIYATGDILVFCDQRNIMRPDAVSEFVKYLTPKNWIYGTKGFKKDWIENFSCVYRDDVISAGIFNERMDAYGGLTQETRARIRRQGFKTEFIPTAIADPLGKSSNRNAKKQEIINMKNTLWRMGLQ